MGQFVDESCLVTVRIWRARRRHGNPAKPLIESGDPGPFRGPFDITK